MFRGTWQWIYIEVNGMYTKNRERCIFGTFWWPHKTSALTDGKTVTTVPIMQRRPWKYSSHSLGCCLGSPCTTVMELQMLQPVAGEQINTTAPAMVTIQVLLETWQRTSCLILIQERKLADTNRMENHDLSHSERLQAWDLNKPKQGKKTPTQVLGTKHVRQEESKESVCIEVPHNASEMQIYFKEYYLRPHLCQETQRQWSSARLASKP